MEIMVLSTLHQIHGEVSYYTYDHLSQIIESFSPDILAVELTPADLRARKQQHVKKEYQHSVYPLIDKLQPKVVPLEPSEPKFSELVQMGKQAREDLQKRSPAAMEQFAMYVTALYDVLFDWWRSPHDVNSAETDRHFEIKHRYQSALFGENEAKGWDLWNTHFLEQILVETTKNASGRMLVLVGVEHGYWLRKRLREQAGVQHLEAEAVLAQ